MYGLENVAVRARSNVRPMPDIAMSNLSTARSPSIEPNVILTYSIRTPSAGASVSSASMSKPWRRPDASFMLNTGVSIVVPTRSTPLFRTCSRRSDIAPAAGPLQPDLAQGNARAEAGVEHLGAAECHHGNGVAARILVELVELEVAVVVGGGARDGLAVLDQMDVRALDAIDHAAHFRRDAATDEAFAVAPEVAVIDPRLGFCFGVHHLEAFVARHPRHLVILDLDGAHRAGRTGLLAAGLLPALIEQMGVERPDLRQ